MTRRDLLKLIDGQDAGSVMLFHCVCARLAGGDPELTSLFWLLQEGVIDRRQFRGRLARVLRGSGAVSATPGRGPAPARLRL